jgi:hypothetical protein
MVSADPCDGTPPILPDRLHEPPTPGPPHADVPPSTPFSAPVNRSQEPASHIRFSRFNSFPDGLSDLERHRCVWSGPSGQNEAAPHQSVRSRSTDFGQVGCEPGQVPTTLKPAVYLGFGFRTKAAKSGGPERTGLRRAIFRRLRAGPVNRSAVKTPGNLPLSAAVGLAESTARMGTGGGSATRFERSLADGGDGTPGMSHAGLAPAGFSCAAECRRWLRASLAGQPLPG